MRPHLIASALKQGRRPEVQVFWNHMTAKDVRDNLSEWDTLTKVCVVRNPWDVLASRFYMERRRSAEVNTVDDLIEQLGATTNWPIYTINEQVVVDHAIRYDELAVQLPQILERVGIRIADLPHAKAGAGRPHYRDVLKQRHIDVVAEVCRQEILTFGFEF